MDRKSKFGFLQKWSKKIRPTSHGTRATNLTITNNGYDTEIRDIYSDKYHTQRYSCSDAHLAAKIQAGATASDLEEYICDSESLDSSVSDTEGNQHEKFQFDIDNIFNPEPVIRAGLHFDSASVKSNATGAEPMQLNSLKCKKNPSTNTTLLILQPLRNRPE